MNKDPSIDTVKGLTELDSTNRPCFDSRYSFCCFRVQSESFSRPFSWFSSASIGFHTHDYQLWYRFWTAVHCLHKLKGGGFDAWGRSVRPIPWFSRFLLSSSCVWISTRSAAQRCHWKNWTHTLRYLPHEQWASIGSRPLWSRWVRRAIWRKTFCAMYYCFMCMWLLIILSLSW